MKKRVWAICYISKHYMDINEELKEKGYRNIRAFIPTVSILEKRRKGKDVYKEVPLLFNYGFIRMPHELAYDRKFLKELRRNINGIHAWLKSLDTMHQKKKRLRIDNPDNFDDFSIVAIATREQIKHFKALSEKNQVYNKQDIVNIKIGDYVTLRGYPFEGIDAEITDINPKTNKMKVVLYPSNNGSKIISTISFENAVYSIYNNFNEELQCNKFEMNSNVITQNTLDDNFSLKQY